MNELDNFFAIDPSNTAAIQMQISDMTVHHDSLNRNILHRAILDERQDIIDLLISPGKRQQGAKKITEWLIKRNDKNETAIHLLASKGDLITLEKIIALYNNPKNTKVKSASEYYKELFIQNKKSESPLTLSFGEKHSEMTSKLLDLLNETTDLEFRFKVLTHANKSKKTIFDLSREHKDELLDKLLSSLHNCISCLEGKDKSYINKEFPIFTKKFALNWKTIQEIALEKGYTDLAKAMTSFGIDSDIALSPVKPSLEQKAKAKATAEVNDSPTTNLTEPQQPLVNDQSDLVGHQLAQSSTLYQSDQKNDEEKTLEDPNKNNLIEFDAAVASVTHSTLIRDGVTSGEESHTEAVVISTSKEAEQQASVTLLKPAIECGALPEGYLPSIYAASTPQKVNVETNSPGAAVLPPRTTLPLKKAIAAAKSQINPKLEALKNALGVHKNGHAKTFQAIKDLLNDSEIDLNVKLGNNRPLQIAALNDLQDVADLLLEKKVKVNAPNTENDTALHIASACGHHKMVEKFIRGGANVNLIGSNNETAEQKAKNPSTKAIFTKHNNQIYISNEIVRIITQDDVESLKILLKQFPTLDLKISNARGITTLHKAALNGATKVSTFLISQVKSLVNSQDEEGKTALHNAVEANKPAIVQALIDAKAKILEDSNKHTPLYYAYQSDKLLEIANIFSRTPAGMEHNRLSIITAINDRDIPALKLLSKQGANLDMPLLENDVTALHLATEMRAIDVVTYLCCTAKVNPSATNKMNEKASDIAALNEDSEILNIIQTAEDAYALRLLVSRNEIGLQHDKGNIVVQDGYVLNNGKRPSDQNGNPAKHPCFSPYNGATEDGARSLYNLLGHDIQTTMHINPEQDQRSTMGPEQDYFKEM